MSQYVAIGSFSFLLVYFEFLHPLQGCSFSQAEMDVLLEMLAHQSPDLNSVI